MSSAVPDAATTLLRLQSSDCHSLGDTGTDSHMKHWMYSPRVREFETVCLCPNFLQNFVRAAKLPLQFMRNALESQILGT